MTKKREWWFWGKGFDTLMQTVVASTIQKLFSLFLIFYDLFYGFLAEWNNSKIWETRNKIKHVKSYLTYLLTAAPLLSSVNVILTSKTSINRKSNLTYLYFQTFDNFAFPYFNSSISYSIHLFCNYFYLIVLFSSLSMFLVFVVADFTELAFFASNVDFTKFSQS